MVCGWMKSEQKEKKIVGEPGRGCGGCILSHIFLDQLQMWHRNKLMCIVQKQNTILTLILVFSVAILFRMCIFVKSLPIYDDLFVMFIFRVKIDRRVRTVELCGCSVGVNVNNSKILMVKHQFSIRDPGFLDISLMHASQAPNSFGRKRKKV